jgi:inosine/xanthosine triphosphatase
MKVIVGSRNPAKYMAVQQAMEGLGFKNCDTVAMEVDSGVRNQPLSDKETIDGALHRARQALVNHEDAEFAIGLEGGVVFDSTPAYTVMICNWGALVAKDGEEFIASGARIPLPDSFKEELLAGRELGDLMDEYCQRKDIRKHEGAVGIFSEGAVTREQMFEHVSRLLVGQWKYSRKKQA